MSGTLVFVDGAPDAGEGFIAWKIATIPYGSEGEEPRNVQECPYFLETGNESSCVSGSGGSMCGGYMGGVRGYVYCTWGLPSVSGDSV
jgi:hypothetical protein